MVDSFRLPVDGESFDDYQHAFHQYYATPEGAGYQQIRREIVEGFVKWLKGYWNGVTVCGIEWSGKQYIIPDSAIGSLLSEAGKKEPTPPEGSQGGIQ